MSAKDVAVVAIVGRTNVGKSTLFNALARRKLAVVHDSHGVTRDRSYVQISYPYPLMLVDTGGLYGDLDDELKDSVRIQAELAIAESDLIICVFDGLHGPHPYDSEVVALLRRVNKPIIWVVNKCEKEITKQNGNEFYGLGVEDLIFLSAAHQQGIHEVRNAIKERLNLTVHDQTELVGREINEPSDNNDTVVNVPPLPIKVAIVGKPNVGKSSLINRILGEERLVTADTSGTTRDSIDITVKREGREFTLIDTAGLRKKAKIESNSVERYSALRSLRAVARADVVVLMLDATQGVPGVQEARIAGLVHERGKPLIVVVNKWDAIEKDHKTVVAYKLAIQNEFKFARYAPLMFISALTGRRCPSLFATITEVMQASEQRIKTAELNRILGRAFEKRPPPTYHGEPVKLFFATQTGTTPPTFIVFVNHATRLKFSYIRYLKNYLRDNFNFVGSDIRIEVRTRRRDKSEDNIVQNL